VLECQHPRLVLGYDKALVLHCCSNFGFETLAVLALATVAPKKPWLTPKRLIRKASCDGILVTSKVAYRSNAILDGVFATAVNGKTECRSIGFGLPAAVNRSSKLRGKIIDCLPIRVLMNAMRIRFRA